MSEPKNKKVNFPEVSDGMNTSIPILTCDKVISVKEVWYALRLTPFDSYTIKDVIDMLVNVNYSDNWLIAQEISPKKKLHFHLVFTSEFDPRGNIKNWLSEKFPGPWLKQDGNLRYNLSLVKDLKKAVTYIVKDDGDFSHSGSINPDYIADCKLKSFKKYSKEAFTVEFEQLKADYKEGVINSKELRVKIIQLKGLYRQPINLSRITEIVLSCMVNKDPSLADNL